MICPKCKTNNAIEEKYCINCGYPLLGQHGDSKEDEAAATGAWFKPKSKKIALIGIALIVLILVVLVIALVLQFSKSESEKTAETLAKGIGHKVSELLNLDNVSLKEKSTYSGVTDYIKFSHLYESSESITVDGVQMPEWLITVSEEDEVIISVVLYDFSVMKETYKGIETGAEIKLSSFSSGDNFTKVKNAIDLDPYTIEYKADDVAVYTYKYYYRDTANNEQARKLTVETKDGDYISSKTQTVYPAGF